MKKLDYYQMEQISGGYTNKQCLYAGAGALLAVMTFSWGAAIGITTGAAVGGCFHEW